MTLDELAINLEQIDGKRIIHCFVDNNKLIATFTMREGLEVEVLTPQERKALDEDNFTQNDLKQKYFELKQIGAADDDKWYN